MFSKTSKGIMSIFLAVIILMAGTIKGYAFSSKIENKAYGWTETVSPGKTIMKRALSREFGLPQWHLTDDQTYEFSNGSIRLKSYMMELLNDTELCKGVTSHSNYMNGYVRARFETTLGIVINDSDTGRIYSFYGDTAETPDTVSGGWSYWYVGHTYCGA